MRAGFGPPLPPVAWLHGFDVFDTLITRCWWRPEDVFLRLGQRLAQEGLIAESPEAFARRRREAEAALRAVPGVEEVSLAEIHAALGWSGQGAATAMRLECATEEEAVRPVAENLDRLARLRAAGADVALLSDTYLDGAALDRLLRRIGLAVPIERIFASSERMASKRTGLLFSHVATHLGQPPDRMTHRGDHPQSDLAVPQGLGMAAELCRLGQATAHERILHAATASSPALVRSALAGGARAARLSMLPRGLPGDAHDAVLRRVGADVAGPILVGFVLWVLAEARHGRIGRLHFVARDGQIMLRAATILLEALGWPVQCRYLLGSRQAWHLPALERLDGTALGWLTKDAELEPLRAVLARGELDAEALRPVLRRCGLHTPDLPPAPRALAHLLAQPEVAAALMGAAATRRAAATGYFRQEGLLDGGRVAIVDLGWHGRMQRSLERLLRLGGAAEAPVGFYLALRCRPRDVACGEMRSFIGDTSFVRRLNPVLFEIFCAADHGTVRRYVARPGGGFGAELAADRDEGVLAWGLPALQEGILAFAREVAEALRRGDDPDDWIAALRQGGMAVYDAFRRTPSTEEAEAFGRFPHATGQSHAATADVAPEIGTMTRLRLGLGLRDGRYAGHWPQASVRRGGGTLADVLFHLKRWRP